MPITPTEVRRHPLWRDGLAAQPATPRRRARRVVLVLVAVAAAVAAVLVLRRD